MPRLEHRRAGDAARVLRCRSGRSCGRFVRRATRSLVAVLSHDRSGGARLRRRRAPLPEHEPEDKPDFHPLEVNLVGVQLAQLAIGILGILVITAEYSTGMIRASLTAVPKRLPVLWAKAAVYGLVTAALMLPALLIAFFIGEAILSTGSTSTSRSPHPGVARAVIGAALYLDVVGLFGARPRSDLRNTAGGIATFVAIMFVLPPLMNVLPASWNDAASPYLPLAAGEAIMATTSGNHLSPWVGLALFCGYAAAALAVAAVLLLRRDT